MSSARQIVAAKSMALLLRSDNLPSVQYMKTIYGLHIHRSGREVSPAGIPSSVKGELVAVGRSVDVESAMMAVVPTGSLVTTVLRCDLIRFPDRRPCLGQGYPCSRTFVCHLDGNPTRDCGRREHRGGLPQTRWHRGEGDPRQEGRRKCRAELAPFCADSRSVRTSVTL